MLVGPPLRAGLVSSIGRIGGPSRGLASSPSLRTLRSSAPLRRSTLRPIAARQAARTATSANGVASLGLGSRLRAFHTSTRELARLGQIKPKRVAVIDGEIVDGLPRPSIWRPIVAALALSLTGSALLALYVNKDTADWVRRMSTGSFSWRFGRGVSDRDIASAKKIAAAKRAQATVNQLPSLFGWLPDFLLVPVVRSYVMFEEWKINSSPAHTAPAALIGAMGVVFAAWHVRGLQGFMRRWFLHRPVSFGKRAEWRSGVTLMTSTFSHQEIWHFAFNSIALYSFGSAAYVYLAAPDPQLPHLQTSTHTPHFYAFLLSAGIAASLGSHLFTNLVRLPRLLRQLASPARLSSPQALAAHHAISPSLGASGAIYAAVTMTALAYPDSEVALIFLPFAGIPIGLGVAGMVAVDVVGILRGWKMFDHVAHLCGAIFGVVYYKWGKGWWYEIRRATGAVEEGTL